jgi:hypothetical protein
MSRPIIKIAGIEREMNEQEYAQWKIDQEDEVLRLAKEAASATAKAALLNRLGITEDEAKLLLS